MNASRAPYLDHDMYYAQEGFLSKSPKSFSCWLMVLMIRKGSLGGLDAYIVLISRFTGLWGRDYNSPFCKIQKENYCYRYIHKEEPSILQPAEQTTDHHASTRGQTTSTVTPLLQLIHTAKHRVSLVVMMTMVMLSIMPHLLILENKVQNQRHKQSHTNNHRPSQCIKVFT